MKTIKLVLLAFILSSVAVSCSKSTVKEEVASEKELPSFTGAWLGVTISMPYIVELESRTQAADGSWNWIWSVRNPNPGNGSNGTVQDLSHWSVTLGSCVMSSDIVGAAYSANGNSWNSFAPKYAVDPSQSCFTGAVVKFDFGTQGTKKSYYKLVVKNEYQVDPTAMAVYKSGKRTGCGLFPFSGMGCNALLND